MRLRRTRPSVPPAARPAARRRWWRRHRVLTALGGLIVLLVVIAAPSFVSALTRPGTDSIASRVAEWGRTHGFSSVIDEAERIQYDLHPPKVGGTPAAGVPDPAGLATRAARAASQLSLPPRMSPFVAKPLRGEGRWHVVSTVAGAPAIASAFMRPDATHTSYVSGLVWMNPRLLTFSLHPGLEDPGSGSWGQPDLLPPAHRRGLLAAFNSGFRLYASRGGYFAYGHVAAPLRAGAASLVIRRDGSAMVGQWGRDVRMSHRVAAVRQNLALIVDNGQPVAGLRQNIEHKWGATLGNTYYVWRSGIGQRPDGSLVYAAGNSLSVQSLADLLAHAGCVRAMELDINPEWTSYILFSGNGHARSPVPHNLLPDMQPSAYRYYSPSSRDFFAVDARRPHHSIP